MQRNRCRSLLPYVAIGYVCAMKGFITSEVGQHGEGVAIESLHDDIALVLGVVDVMHGRVHGGVVAIQGGKLRAPEPHLALIAEEQSDRRIWFGEGALDKARQGHRDITAFIDLSDKRVHFLSSFTGKDKIFNLENFALFVHGWFDRKDVSLLRCRLFLA